MFWLISGRPGAGKSLFAARLATDYAAKGRRVVANYPLSFASLSSKRGSKLNRASPEILDGVPTREQLDQIGFGGVSEETAGLLILDEVGVTLGARTWNQSDREAILGWFAEHRKRFWDVVIICQHTAQVDKSIRVSYPDSYVMVRRLDRVKLLGLVRLPKVHLAVGKYGMEPGAPVNERWLIRGPAYYPVYDSHRVVAQHSQDGCYSSLSRWHLVDRYREPLDIKKAAKAALGVYLRSVAYCCCLTAAAVTGRSPVAVAVRWGIVQPKSFSC